MLKINPAHYCYDTGIGIIIRLINRRNEKRIWEKIGKE
jgi:hypothetical protein